MQPINPSTEYQTYGLGHYIRVLNRRKLVVLTLLFGVLCGVVIANLYMTPIYEAESTIQVKEAKSQQRGMMLGELGFTYANPVITEIEILKSRTNAEEVVRRLHLNWQVKPVGKESKLKISAFNSKAEKPIYKIRVLEDNGFEIKNGSGKILGTARLGQPFQNEELTLRIDEFTAKPGQTFEIRLAQVRDVAEALRKSIKAQEKPRQSSIISLSYQHPDPELARDVVNSLVDVYLQQSVALRSEEAAKTVSFLEEQLENIRRSLEKAEKDLEMYKSSTGLVKLDSEGEELIRKLSEMERAIAELQLKRRQTEIAIDALAEAIRRGRVYSPAILKDDPVVAQIASKLAELDVKRQTLLSEYTEEYPAVKALWEEVAETQKKLLNTYKNILASIETQEKTLRSQLAHYESKLKAMPGAEKELLSLTRVAKVTGDIYMFLLQKYEEARILRASTIGSAIVVDPAITPARPVKPKKSQNILIGLVVGLLSGVGAAFFLERLDDTVKDDEEARELTGLPILAVIPAIRRRRKKPEEDPIKLIAHRSPRSGVTEAFRALRTSLHFLKAGEEKKVILVTSTFPEEGKTTTSSNLAVVFSQTGQKVLLIDCDLRRSSQHKLFGVERSPGLTEYLVGDAPLEAIKRPTGIENLTLVTAGSLPPNPSELLGSKAMESFIQMAKENYDHVIVDAPPMAAVTDASVLIPLVDLIVLVMEAGRVPRKVLTRVVEQFSEFKAPVCGITVNDKEAKAARYGYYSSYGRYKKGRYYGYYRYGYGYGYGYGYYSEEEEGPKVSWFRRLFGKRDRS